MPPFKTPAGMTKRQLSIIELISSPEVSIAPNRDAKFFKLENAEERKARILSKEVVSAILKPKRKRKRRGPNHINTKVAKPKKSRRSRGRPRKQRKKQHKDENISQKTSTKKYHTLIIR